MVKLEVLPITEVEGLTKEYCEEHFPVRYEKALKFRQHADFLRCVAAGELLVRAGIAESSIHFDSHGKPLADGVCFNLSHSGDYAVLAVASTSVGVDIEKVDPSHLSVAKKVLTAEENEWVSGDACRFFKLWTLKEAVIKCFGLGLSMPMESFSVLDLALSSSSIVNDVSLCSECTQIGDYLVSIVYKEQ